MDSTGRPCQNSTGEYHLYQNILLKLSPPKKTENLDTNIIFHIIVIMSAFSLAVNPIPSQAPVYVEESQETGKWNPHVTLLTENCLLVVFPSVSGTSLAPPEMVIFNLIFLNIFVEE